MIGMCHLPFGSEMALLRAVPEVDLCLSGDDHIGTIRYDRKQLLVEAGSNLQFLAVIDLHVSKQKGGDREIVV